MSSENDIGIYQNFLTIQEVSRYLGIKPKTLYARVNEIPHYKVGRLIRFRKDEIDAWMQKHRVGKGENDQDEKQGQEKNATPATEPALEPPKARRSRKRSGPVTDIDRMISKAIDHVKGEGYTASHGKSDQVKGSGKEV